MRIVLPNRSLIVLLAAGLLSACAAGPDGEVLAQRYRASVPIVPDVSVLAKPNAYDPRRWPVRQVQSLVSGCWNIERDGRYNESGSFRIKARLAPDGSVIESEVVNAEAMLLDPVFRELALSAQQALTACGPLPLPPADYEGWRELTFRFMPQVASPTSDSVVLSAAQTAVSAPMALSEIDSLRGDVQRCWDVPAEIAGAENASVELRLSLDPDGTVRRAEVVGEGRARKDRVYRLAAEAAMRAIMRCSPLRGLPPSKYEAWKVIYLMFDPWTLRDLP